jgi:hypothetical protein
LQPNRAYVVPHPIFQVLQGNNLAVLYKSLIINPLILTKISPKIPLARVKIVHMFRAAFKEGRNRAAGKSSGEKKWK